MRKPGYAQQRGIVEVSYEDFVIDGRRHENDLQLAVCLQKLSQFEEQEVAIDRAFVYLSGICEAVSKYSDRWL